VLGAGKAEPAKEFITVPISKVELLAGKENRHLRIAFHSTDSRDGCRLLGFAISLLDNFERIVQLRRDGDRASTVLPWIRVGDAYMDAIIHVCSVNRDGCD
jgi:hypothetical protein